MMQGKPGDHFLVRIAGVTLLYFAAARIGLMYAVVGSTVTLVWPPSGIALVAILAYGYRVAFGIALGAFLANAWTGLPLDLAAGIAMGNAAEALVGAFLLKNLAHFDNALNRRRDVLALIILTAIYSTTISASVGVATLGEGGLISAEDSAHVWLKWWLGDMMGILVFAPLLLTCLYHSRPALTPAKLAEALSLLTLLLVAGYMIFSTPELAGHGYYPASLAVFPFVIWGSLRFDQWGATLVTCLVSVLAIWGTTQGTGPFVVGSPVDSLVGWCIFANIVSVTGLLLAASSAEQQRAQAEIRSAKDTLERRVRIRTEALARTNASLRQEMAKRRRLEADLIKISETQQRNMGRELHDGLGQYLTSIAFFGATLQQKLRTQARPEEADVADRVVAMLNEAVNMTRAIAKGLYPVALEARGLPAALEQLAENTRGREGVACTFRAAPDVRIDDPLVAINLYRIAQEAIANAVRHSQAHHIWIDLTYAKDHHRLVIGDDGIGFDPKSIELSQGLGLHNLRYRAHLLGGAFDMERNATGGTTVSIIYPAQEVDPIED